MDLKKYDAKNFNGYEESTKIDNVLNALIKDFPTEDEKALVQLWRYARTLKTSFEMLEKFATENLEKMR